MPKLKIISAREILAFFKTQGFVFDHQRGSHITLIKRIGSHYQKALIPNHSEIAKGTLKAIYNQAKKTIDKEALDKFFYTK